MKSQARKWDFSRWWCFAGKLAGRESLCGKLVLDLVVLHCKQDGEDGEEEGMHFGAFNFLFFHYFFWMPSSDGLWTGLWSVLSTFWCRGHR